ncbi:MAG: hypothetical protein DI629_21240 [Mesorhizobium amorphae]|nr:MAG: hypothetical protein DI629_21240 [Mesorhizobium amorphae]
MDPRTKDVLEAARIAARGIDARAAERAAAIAEEELSDPLAWSGDGARGRAAAAALAEARADLSLARGAGSLNLLAEAAEDPDLAAEALVEAERLLRALRRRGAPAGDAAVVTISAGAGGADARDFAEMSLRETIARAGRLGLDVEVEDETRDDLCGLREATLSVSGPGAFAEFARGAGKRRLVRISPFGAGRRQTSFCLVSVIPRSGRDGPAADIPRSEIRVETYRDTGPGGQHRNATDSAVRVTHVPTGISAKSALRSQHENLRIAMRTLSDRVAAAAAAAKRAETEAAREGGGPAGFGGHAVTIVLHPFRLVRNERTGASSADADGWLSGGCETVR